MKFALLVVALLALLVLSPVSAPARAATTPDYKVYTNWVVSYTGYAETYMGPFKNPGPTYTAYDNQTFRITLRAADNLAHYFYIDLDGSKTLSAGDKISSYPYDSASPWSFEIQFPAGTYAYRDAMYNSTAGWIDTGISGTLNVDAAPAQPQQWWHWDPFWIFGLFIEVAVAGYISYVLFHAFQIHRNKRKLRQTSPEIHKWLKAVMDPEGPTRPTEEYVMNLRVEKRKMRKQQEADRKAERDFAPKPPESPRQRHPRRRRFRR